MTFATSRAWSSGVRFLWMMPMPPSCARPRARSASVTVSIGAEMSGMCRSIFRVRRVAVSARSGVTELWAGMRRTSSNVMPSRMILASIGGSCGPRPRPSIPRPKPRGGFRFHLFPVRCSVPPQGAAPRARAAREGHNPHRSSATASNLRFHGSSPQRTPRTALDQPSRHDRRRGQEGVDHVARGDHSSRRLRLDREERPSPARPPPRRPEGPRRPTSARPT